MTWIPRGVHADRGDCKFGGHLRTIGVSLLLMQFLAHHILLHGLMLIPAFVALELDSFTHERALNAR